ncbi:MAG TPA: transcriptional regulator GcvA [Burkholderiaceae bacterium]|nr:transcriptional regulator GcvA [Burkholderiaceae bacterium]
MRRSRDLPSLDLLKGFESAARHSSFTRAAEELFVTQSAVSRQVKALEEQLGVPLFKRDTRTLVLTEAGQMLFASVTDILRTLDDTVTRIGAADLERRLTVTTTVSLASVWLVPRLSLFRAAHPGIAVHLVATNDLLHLERSQIDLAIRLSITDHVPSNAMPLIGEKVFPVCSPQLLNDPTRPLRRPEDLAHHVLVHFDEAAGRYPSLTWSRWLATRGLGSLQPAGLAGFNLYDHVIQAALAGSGVALGRSPLVNDLLRRGVLVEPFAERSETGFQYYVVVAEASAERAAVNAFIGWLKEQLACDT